MGGDSDEWVSKGALGTRPLIPRKGLHHIVVSNCDEFHFNEVVVVLFVTLFWVCVAVFVLSGSKPVKCFSVPQSLTGKDTLFKTYYMRLADRFNFN